MPTAVTPSQLQSQLTQGSISPLYLLTGEEDLLRDHALAAVKVAVLGAENDDFNCDVLYGDETEGAHIVACASEVAVFSPRRLVIVKAADKLSARHADTLLQYVNAPNSSTVLVFVAAKLDGRLKLTQALVKAGVVVDCSPLKEPQLIQWLKLDAGRVGITLTEEAAQLLKEGCGGSLNSVRRELEKLAAFVPGHRAVTVQDVETLRGTEPGASVFDLAAAIGARNLGRALAIVARNLEGGEAPLRVLGSLAWQYRRLWKMKELMRQGGREGEAAKTLRMDPYRVRTVLSQYSDAHLQEALRAFLTTDNQLKGGSGGKPAMILERLVLQLCPLGGTAEHSPESRTNSVQAAGRAKAVSNVRTISAPRPKN